MTLLILHPELVFVAALLGVLMFYPPPKRLLIAISVAIIFLPFWPIMVLRLVAVWTVDLCDWLCRDRMLTRPLTRAANFLMTKW